MPAPQRLEAYPMWMIELAAAFTRKEVRHVTYVIPDQRLMNQYRRQVYGLQRAIAMLPHMERLEYSEFLAARVEIRGSDLHIMHVDEQLPEPKRKE